MFVREGEGVYQFGTKRVHVKIEQDKIYSTFFNILNTFYAILLNLVRVGGGYISVEEFLEIYTPIELEKMIKNSGISH